MKKVNKVILVLSFIFLTNYATAESDFNKEAIRFNNSKELKSIQEPELQSLKNMMKIEI